MNRIATFAVATATLMASTAPALAAEMAPKTTAAPAIVVAQCERDALTQASFRERYGSRPVYVTAREVLSARAAGERWSAPRCMSVREHARLVSAMTSYAAVR